MNQIDLHGRHAVITGGASGLGFASAQRMIASGAQVTLWDINAQLAEQAAAQLGAGTRWQGVDITKEASVQTATEKTLRHAGVDILLNSAGITGPNMKLWEYQPADWRAVIEINLTGTYLCCRALVPSMRERNYGRIINIASVAGKDGNPNASAYSASKAAVIGLTKSLGKELVDVNIRVNCITPAAIETPMFDQMKPEFIAFMKSKIPMGRFGLPGEVASMVAWLASEDCSFSTGAVFDLSGGRSTY